MKGTENWFGRRKKKKWQLIRFSVSVSVHLWFEMVEIFFNFSNIKYNLFCLYKHWINFMRHYTSDRESQLKLTFSRSSGKLNPLKNSNNLTVTETYLINFLANAHVCVDTYLLNTNKAICIALQGLPFGRNYVANAEEYNSCRCFWDIYFHRIKKKIIIIIWFYQLYKKWKDKRKILRCESSGV